MFWYLSCCSVLPRVAACCSVLRRIALCDLDPSSRGAKIMAVLHVISFLCVAACCSVLQRVAALQCESLCDLDHCVTWIFHRVVLITIKAVLRVISFVCCSVLQCAIV